MHDDWALLDALLWQIDAVDPTPRVIVVGGSPEGFTTTLPLQPIADSTAPRSVVVDFADTYGSVTARTFAFSPVDVGALSVATVSKHECGIDLDGFLRWIGLVAVWTALLGFLLVLGTTGLVAAIRRAVRGAPLDP